MPKNALLSSGPAPRQNRLLAALPAVEYERLLPHLELVSTPLEWAFYESGDKQEHVFFPATSIMCTLYVTKDGSSTATAVVGNEGVVGVSVFMGGESTPNRAVAYSAGYSYRLAARMLKAEFSQGGSLQHLLLRYTQALMTQMLQTAVCNRHHSVEQQLCRLLLLSLDRSPSSALTLSHELIADMLGVRRESISGAASTLKAAGLIRYSRGHITVPDRCKLEAQVCECYAVVKKEDDRLLLQVPSLSLRPSSAWPVTARNSLLREFGSFDQAMHG